MAEIKKISTELQLLDKFLDTSGDAGTSGQILSSTGTGINWVSGSAIPGVPGGSGTVNTIPLWTPDGNTLGNSIITQPASAEVRVAGILKVNSTVSGYSSTKIQTGGFGDSQSGINILNSTTGYGYILFGDGSGADLYRGQITYKHDDDYMAFNAAGSERMRITSAGKVGIGTTSPLANLDIGNDGGSIYQRWSYDNPGANNYFLSLSETVTSGNVRFCFNQKNAGTNYDNVLVFNQGNVGIGTASPNQSNLVVSPSAQSADVDGITVVYNPDGATNRVRSQLKIDDFSGVLELTNSADTIATYITAGGDSYFTAGNVGIGETSPDSKLHIHQTGSGTLTTIITEDDARKLFIGRDAINCKDLNNNAAILYLNQAGGNVAISNSLGIGTTSPSEKLEVVGDIKTSGTGNTQVILESGGACVMDLLNAQSEAYLRTTSAHDLYFRTTNINRMVIKAAGKVGIGTNSPDKDLTVGGVNPTHGINLRTKSGSSEWLLWQVEQYFSQEGYMRMFNDNVAKIQFRANGGSYFVGGNVGIGTTSPDSKLEVITSGTNTVLELDNSDSNYTVIQYNASGATKGFSGFNSGFMLFGGEAGTTTRLQSGGSYAATILENGNFGIGTTSPDTLLHLKSSGPKIKLQDTGNWGSNATGGVEFYDQNSLMAFSEINSAGDYLNYLVEAGNMTFGTSNTERMRITAGGSVGIGTTSPGEKLEVAGNIQASGAIFQGTTSSTIALKTSGATLRANIIGNNNGLELGVFGTKSINFEWDAVTKIQMKSTGEGIFAGKVSINNASSRDSILNIVDDGTNGNIAFENDSGDVVGIITSVVDELNIRVGDGISMSDSIRLRLTESGNLVIAGTLTQNSDVRLKENIKPIESALDKVKQMQGVEFNKINSSTKEIGVVAQEIEKIIPELVLEDKEGIKSVAYGNITAVLIEAIKEQQKQIEELKQQLNK